MVKMRPAKLSDIPILQKWDEAQHVIDSDPNDVWKWAGEIPRNMPWRWQWIAEINGEPIGFVQIIEASQEETHYWGNVAIGTFAIDIWIGSENNLGKGYGTQIMLQALSFCFNQGALKVLIDPLKSNKNAIRFYQKLGFIFLEERVFDEDVCSVHYFPREIWGHS